MVVQLVLKTRNAESKNSVRDTSMFLKIPFGSSERINYGGNWSADCSLLRLGLLSISVTPNEEFN